MLDQTRRLVPTTKTRFVFGNNLPDLLWALVLVSGGFFFFLSGSTYLANPIGAGSFLLVMFQVALGAISDCNYLVLDRDGLQYYGPFGRRYAPWRDIHFLHVTQEPDGLFFTLEDARRRVFQFPVEVSERDQFEHFIRRYANLADGYPTRLHSNWRASAYVATIWAISTLLTFLILGPNRVIWLGLVHFLYYLGRSLVAIDTLELTSETLTVRYALPFRERRRITREQVNIATAELWQAFITGETDVPISATHPDSQKRDRLQLEGYQGGPYRALQILAAWHESDPSSMRHATRPHQAAGPAHRDPNRRHSRHAL